MPYKNFETTKFKFRKNWKDSKANKITIINQKDKQLQIVNELGKTVPVNNKFDYILDLTTEWSNPDDFELDGEDTDYAYKRWEVELTGLKFIDCISLRHNFNFRFGTSGADIRVGSPEYTAIQTVHYIYAENLVAEYGENKFTFHYGWVLDNSNPAIYEIDEDGLQTRLQLSFLNPNFYL